MASGTFKKILIVDDEPNIVMAIKHILRMKGLHSMEANDGETALKLVKDTDPHLIILERDDASGWMDLRWQNP